MSTEPESLLALIGAQMDSAMSKLEVRLIDRFASKKDHEADMGIIHKALDNHEERLGALERERSGRSYLSLWQRWFFGGIGFAVVGSLVYLASYHLR